MRRRQVVFPEPDGPKKVKNSPSRTEKLTSSTAFTFPNVRRTWVKVTASIASVISRELLRRRAPVAAGCAASCQCRILHHSVSRTMPDHDVLGDLVVLDRFGREVLAETRLLEAAVRALGRERPVIGDPHRAELERGRHAQEG